MAFEFATSGRIIFGNGSLNKVREIAPGFGRKALVVTGSGSVPLAPLMAVLDEAGVDVSLFRVGREPDIPTIDRGLALAKETGSEFVIGFGGGPHWIQQKRFPLC